MRWRPATGAAADLARVSSSPGGLAMAPLTGPDIHSLTAPSSGQVARGTIRPRKRETSTGSRLPDVERHPRSRAELAWIVRELCGGKFGFGNLEKGCMDSTTALILILAFVLVAATVWFVAQQRGQDLQDDAGPEQPGAGWASGDHRRADRVMARGQASGATLPLRTLSAVEREVFARRWRSTETRFLDDPAGAIQEADQLLREVMQRRGYPVGAGEHRAAGPVVVHPREVDTHAAARRAVQRAARGEASTTELRQAMAHYRTMFEGELGAALQPARRTPRS
jgi:hypothetical protein